MTDSQLRTMALVAALAVLAGLSVLLILSGRDPSGVSFQEILQGILMIVSVLAGAHAANGKSATIIRTSELPPPKAGPGPDTTVINGRRAGDPPTP